MNARHALIALFALATLCSCAAPLQNGGVEVRPGAAERLEALCRFGGSSAQEVCAAPEENE
jgi:hypothetical protein